MSLQRLQKIIAAAGIASRRKAEELIAAGRVTVNGETITALGSKADPERDQVRVDGKPLRLPERYLYLVLNKPKGYVTTVSDPEGRRTVMELVRGVGARVYPVGRLDYHSEGLLILTNDGALAQQLMHAASHVPKTYWVKTGGRPNEEALDKLRRGIALPAFAAPLRARPGRAVRGAARARQVPAVKTAPAKIRLLRDASNPWYEVTLLEGRSRQIRRMFEAIGHHVEKIKRVRYGPLELDLEPGEVRALKPVEVARLRAAVAGRRPRPAPWE
jgi:23S rRNA pseudouridine2605 synthase